MANQENTESKEKKEEALLKRIAKFRLKKAYNSVNYLLTIILALIVGVFIINTIGDKTFWNDDYATESLIKNKSDLKERLQKYERNLNSYDRLSEKLRKYNDTIKRLSFEKNIVDSLIISYKDKLSPERIVNILKIYRKDLINVYTDQVFSLPFYFDNNREYLDGLYTLYDRDKLLESNDPEVYIKNVINTGIFSRTELFLTKSGSDINESFLNRIKDPNQFFDENRSDLSMIIELEIEHLQIAKVSAEFNKEKTGNDIKDIDNQLKSLNESNLRKTLAKFILPFYGIIAVLLMLIPYVYKKVVDETKPNMVLERIFERNLLLKIFAVFILTASILILGIGGFIDDKVLGTLLGGISVYVLQGSIGKQEEKNHVNDNEKDKNESDKTKGNCNDNNSRNNLNKKKEDDDKTAKDEPNAKDDVVE